MECDDTRDVMDWRAASRSRSRAPMAMEWRPASQSRSRSRPPLMGGMPFQSLLPQMSSAEMPHSYMTGYTVTGPSPSFMNRNVPIAAEADRAQTVGVENNNSEAAKSGAIAIPNASLKGLDEEGEHAVEDGARVGSGSVQGHATSVSLLTKSLQMFSESPPGHGVDFLRDHLDQQNVGSSVALSQSSKDRGPLALNLDRRGSQPTIDPPLHRQEEEQRKEDHPGMSHPPHPAPPREHAPQSLPAYYQKLQQQLNDQMGGFVDGAEWQDGMHGPPMEGFPKKARKTSFDHTVGRGQGEPSLRGRDQIDGEPLEPSAIMVRDHLRSCGVETDAAFTATSRGGGHVSTNLFCGSHQRKPNLYRTSQSLSRLSLDLFPPGLGSILQRAIEQHAVHQNRHTRRRFSLWPSPDEDGDSYRCDRLPLSSRRRPITFG